MSEQLSNRQTTLMMDYGTGMKQVDGLSDDDPPIELPELELIEETYGQDGTMYVRSTSMQGGEVVVHLGPTSRTGAEWLRVLAQIQQGALVTWRGVYSDSLNGYSTSLEGGYLKTAPTGVSPGKNNDFTFVFERTLPQFDGVDFSPPPAYSLPAPVGTTP